LKMAKIKSSFFCQSCGYESPKWLGKCPSCDEWNTFIEEVIERKSGGSSRPIQSTGKVPKPVSLKDISGEEGERIITPISEINRVLGGGLVKGSLVLVGGEPGIGKSTLLLQLAMKMPGAKVLYVSGEESPAQIKMRADRMGENSDCYLLPETQTQNIFKQIEILEPELLIIDSIQTMVSAFIDSPPGSISQVRECAAEFHRYGKESGTPVFLIGHITKDGQLAGPKILEHMVDTVLQFEGDRNMVFRILRTSKNRFGSTSELGIFEMTEKGLKEVPNPSEILAGNGLDQGSGSALGATIEGNRPLIVEVQSLVSPATYGTAQRSATGFDHKRLNMILAVLEKRLKLQFSNQDVFVNIAGGLKVEDTAMDLAVCMSLVSSYLDIELSNGMVFVGEIGLGGEIRGVTRIDRRIQEVSKLGYTEIFVPENNLKGLNSVQQGVRIHPETKFVDVYKKTFKS
jgi:DNA repair protein RadA/Sms